MVLDGQHPAIIRNAVATPGGCTIGGLLTMEDGKIRSTMVVSIDDSLLILGENNPGSYERSKWIRKDATMKVIAKVKGENLSRQLIVAYMNFSALRWSFSHQ